MAALMKFDTLSWAKKLEEAGVPPKQAEVQVDLIFRAIDDNICTKHDLKELKSSSRQSLRELEGNVNIRLKELELKIEEVKKDLVVSIEGVKKDIAISVEKLNCSIETVKGSFHKQLAGWVLGVSAIQATLIIGILRYIH